jgi:hypothetical protein
MAKLTKFRTDAHKERGGQWFPFREGIEFLIASIECAAYQGAFRAALKQHKHRLRADAIDDETMAKMQAKLIADHLLLDWKNVDDDDGKPLTFSTAAAERFLADPQLRSVAKFVLECAGDEAAYRAETQEAVKGN